MKIEMLKNYHDSFVCSLIFGQSPRKERGSKAAGCLPLVYMYVHMYVPFFWTWHLKKCLQIHHKRPVEYSDDQNRIWWLKVKGHCDLIYLILMNAISQENLKGISSNLSQTWDGLIGIWWSEVKGRCGLAKHVFGQKSIIHTLIMTKFHTNVLKNKMTS